MRILLKQIWTQTGTWGDRNYDQAYGYYLADAQWVFDTETRQVVYTPAPLNGSYTVDQSTGEAPPAGVSLDPAEEFYFYASGPVRTGYFHDGTGGFTTLVETLVVTTTVIGCDCYGTEAGIVDVTATGMAQGTLTYLWSDEATTADRSQLKAGTYLLTVRHESGAQVVRQVVVGQNPQLILEIRKASRTLSVLPRGGVAPYSYAWSDGETGAERLGSIPAKSPTAWAARPACRPPWTPTASTFPTTPSSYAWTRARPTGLTPPPSRGSLSCAPSTWRRLT